MQAQILALGERFERGLTEIKEMLAGFDERLRHLENREAGCQPIVTARIDAAWRKLDEHETKLEKLSKTENQVNLMIGIAGWALGLVTLVLGTVLVALATGQATLIFR